jgi:hypothetical protein
MNGWWRKRREGNKDGNHQPKQSRRPDVQRRETMKTGGKSRGMRDRGGQENGRSRGDIAGVREGEDVELMLKGGVGKIQIEIRRETGGRGRAKLKRKQRITWD